MRCDVFRTLYLKCFSQLFDFCLAPDTTGDGTGCDNMTAVIVRFKKDGETTKVNGDAPVAAEEESASSKRKESEAAKEQVPEDDDPPSKKAKLDGEVKDCGSKATAPSSSSVS